MWSHHDDAVMPFGRYVRLYTLHRVEYPAELLLVQIRIQTLRYSYLPLRAAPLDAAYSRDPHAGVEVVRGTVLPRLQALLDAGDPVRELGLVEGQDAAWRRYAAQRGLPAEPVRVPAIQMPQRVASIPARSRTSERLARIQHALELLQTAADTAATLAAAWQNWQIGRERRQLLEAQRTLLHDAIQVQLDGQTQALDRALDPAYVRGYLADHVGDMVFDAVFGDAPEDDE